jgi:hypothetical protein
MLKWLKNLFVKRPQEPLGPAICANCYHGGHGWRSKYFDGRCEKSVKHISTDSVTGDYKTVELVSCRKKNPRGYCQDYNGPCASPPAPDD